MWDLYVPRKTGGIVMIIQSKKVWFADQFVEAQIEVKDGKVRIDAKICTGCGVCQQICKFNAIRKAGEVSV